MFRNGEFEDSFNPTAAKKHPSYFQKPLPVLQMQSKIAKLEVPSQKVDEKTYYEYTTSSVPSVPITYDTVYDPNNPNADWSGLVSKQFQSKRQVNEYHPSKQVSMVQEGGGIISKEIKQEWPRRRRDYIPPTENSKGSIINGIDVTDQERWKTNMQRQNNFEATSRSQLVLNKRLGTKGTGTVSNTGSQNENLQNYSNNPTPNGTPRGYGYHNEISNKIPIQPSTINDNSHSIVDDVYNPYSLAGYRAPVKLATGSLLSNLGSSLVGKLSDTTQPPKASSYIPSKNLISQNYNPAPGIITNNLIAFYVLNHILYIMLNTKIL
jgi:hypothetical protein